MLVKMISKPRDHACERQSTFIQASTPHLPTSHYASSYASALQRLSSCHVLPQAAWVVRVSTTLMNHAFHFSQTNTTFISPWGAFSPLKAFLLPFSPCGGNFARFFSVWGGFFSQFKSLFCSFFPCRGFFATFFSMWGPFCYVFLLMGFFFTI